MKYLFIILFVAFSSTLTAQNFFKPIKIKTPKAYQISANPNVLKVGVTDLDSSFNAIRPIVTGATLFSGGTVKAMAGTGLSWQNITYNYANQRSYVNYSISLLAFAGGSVIPEKPTDIFSLGFMLSALNNTIGIGAAATRINDKIRIGPMLNFSINFNN